MAVLCVTASAGWTDPSDMTARQIVERIQQRLAIEPPAGTVDSFKAGNPDAAVKGIAVTMMATYDVLQRAAAAGDNLVITHEPTFYNHRDVTADLEKQGDAVLNEKEKFIADHHLIIWRFHDGWHARREDGILQGMARALGWLKYENSETPALFSLPPTNLRDLGREVQEKLRINVARMVGDPTLTVRQIGFLPGAAGSSKQIQLLERPDVEALLIGETPEWETVEYASDAASQGKRKSLIILGHIPSEQEGMDECTSWLKTFISGVPVRFIAAREPFWLRGPVNSK